MRHQKAGRRLGRTTEHRKALLANLVTSLIEHEQIRTTLPKAKEARRLADKMITYAKGRSLHHRRLAARTIRDHEALAKLFATLGPRFAMRNGGYTRVLRLGRRLGDAAPMAILEWVERTPKETPAETEEKKRARKAKKAGEKGAEASRPEEKAKKAEGEEKPAKAARKKAVAEPKAEAAEKRAKKTKK